MSTATMTPLVEPKSSAIGPRAGLVPWRFSPLGVALRLFITCWLVYVLHFATNTVREIYPALSLGDHLSFDVSEYVGLHPDIFEIPGRGAFINNNPGASIMGALPYTLARPVIDIIVEHVQRIRALSPDSGTVEYKAVYPMAREFYRKAREHGLDVKFGLAAGVMQAFCMAPLSALSAVVMFYILLHLTSSVRASLALALLYAIATPVFYRTAQLNQNLLVSHFTFFAFALLWWPWEHSLLSQRLRYLLAGLLCGWTIVLDYSGLVVIVALSIYVLVRHLPLLKQARLSFDLLYYGAGVLFGIAVLMTYQWLSFGSPFFPAQHYMPPATYSHQGYAGMDWPQIDLLWDTAFGIRFGLFVSAPLLLLVLYIPAWFRGTRIVSRQETWFIILFSIAFLLFCSANQYGRMQFNTGVRHIVPVVPFLFLLVAGVLLRLPRVIAIFVGIATSYWSWCLAMYRDVEQGSGVLESLIHITFEGFRFPWLITLERMGYFTGGIIVIPLLVIFGTILWILWSVNIPVRMRSRTYG